MSIVGIDFGNLWQVIAQTSKGGVDVILNDASIRQTATCLSFQGKQRFFGDAAAAMARSNVKNTVSMMKVLVGRSYSDPAVQAELAQAPFDHCATAEGGVGIVVSYNDEPTVIPVEHLFAMMLSVAQKTVSRANNGVNIADSVLAVPCHFTDAQVRGVLSACSIVGLHCLKVVKETTAIALSYGIYKSAKGLFSETEPVHVMFIDVGYTGYSVVIADFVQEKLVIRATAWDTSIGGRAFDDVVIEFLAEQFQAKTKIDVRGNKKAMLKLQAAAEKAKKTLSPLGVREANVSVECLAEDRDLNCILTLDEFEARCASLVAKLEGPIRSALAEAGISASQLADVEIVGGGSRVQCVKRQIGAILGLDASAINFGLKTTMNSDEAVCRGSALQCAILSSRVKVKPFHIMDRIDFPIEVRYEGTTGGAPAEGAEAEDDAPADHSAMLTSTTGGFESVQVFSRGDEFPRKPRRLTFRNKSSSFDITVQYAASAIRSSASDTRCNVLPMGQTPSIGTYRVNIPESYRSTPNGEGRDVRVTFNLDRSGCVVITSAELMEELAPEPVEEGKEADAAPAKKKFRKVPLQVTTVESFSLSPAAIKQCIEVEAAMTAADNLIRETADKRNELEAFIYSIRAKLESSLKKYCTPAEHKSIQTAANEAEEWLYGDGFESTKQEYVKRLDQLRGPANLVEFRLSEETNRPAAAEILKQQISTIRAFAANNDASHDHITVEERETLRSECEKAESWLYDMLSKQADVAQSADPVLTVESISRRVKDLNNATHAITTKKRPVPKPAEAKPAPASEEKKESGDDAKASAEGSVESKQADAGSEKMDTTD